MSEFFPLVLDGMTLGLQSLVQVAREHRPVVLCPDARERMEESQNWGGRAGTKPTRLWGDHWFRFLGPGDHSARTARTAQCQSGSKPCSWRGSAATDADCPCHDAVTANALAKGVSGCRPYWWTLSWPC